MSVDITQITDHDARALARLATQFSASPRLRALISTMTAQVQQLEDLLMSVLLGYRLDTPAQGKQLDTLGKLVGQAREASTDADFRIRISARLRANYSTGSAEDILRVFHILLPSETLTLTAEYPAGVVLDMLEAVDVDLVPLFARFLQDTKAGGIRAQCVYSLVDPAHTFTIAAVQDTSSSSALLGCADDAQTTGGHLTGVFG